MLELMALFTVVTLAFVALGVLMVIGFFLKLTFKLLLLPLTLIGVVLKVVVGAVLLVLGICIAPVLFAALLIALIVALPFLLVAGLVGLGVAAAT